MDDLIRECRPTFYRVCRRKSTEGFQSVPYVVALFSATLWILYALLKTNAGLLITINAVGCVIETAYVAVYFIYAPKAAKMFTAKLVLLVNVGMFGSILLLTLLFAKGAKRVEVLGWICMSFSVSVFVAPLSIIVSRNPSASAVVLRGITILTRSVVAFSETCDPNEERGVHAILAVLLPHLERRRLLPNVLGFIFGVLQMVLYAVYRNQETAMVEQKLPEHIASKVLEIYAIEVKEKVQNRVQEEQDEDNQGMAAAPMEKKMKPAEV
ncbi:hypothetical protein BHE74_00031639 [Ensete ventricosum]|nr:hypothetical protein GW17_00030938 [Ensete ventricosum]RWW61303.1 hypothetical protein BHE74_00031639 [Ensete ventricosum]